MTLRFDNSFVRELPGDTSGNNRPRQVHGAAYSTVEPTRVAAPRLIAYSREMSDVLGIEPDALSRDPLLSVLGGNGLLDGMQPYSANYGGHQFGQWAGQLGDGRAITLGETINASGQRWELQLKGAGRTPYSRSADGRAVLRSSIREFLCSEAMHHLGVATTRALSLVATGEQVLRDMFYDGRAKLEPGAIVCRVAPSFIRFGNFELPPSRGDMPLLRQLVEFTIRRDFPEIAGASRDIDERVRADWFGEVCVRTARMIADWMRVGFVHGVMNTDNMSILGLTIDYGPYGWVDNFDPDWTPNTTDAGGRRYRFGHQPQVAYWNLTQLANALAPIFDSTDPLEDGLKRCVEEYNALARAHAGAKLGLRECRDADIELLESLHAMMVRAEVDMTIFFRRLADADTASPSLEPLRDAFYDEAKMREAEPALVEWLARYAARVGEDAIDPDVRRAAMNAVNPKYVLRNYLAQQAIDRAEDGEEGSVMELLDVLRRPYDEQPGNERFAARRPDWARDRAGCSMLSCSS
jgi:serine/tyrosine/threonine adenylyltransferase